MPASEHRDVNLPELLEVYYTYLRQLRESGSTDFRRFCDDHPDLADNLGKLHAVVQLAQVAVRSGSFQQSLRERFGDQAEVTVRLEEGHGVPPSGGPASAPAEAGTPYQTGRYTLENEVAHGGMGVIWRVRDRDLSRTLAMKVMTGAPDTSAATDATSRINLARFLEEAQVTAQLDHPGIVPVHEVGFDAQGQPFFIMKLVKGRDLNEIFKLARAEQEGWNLPRAVGVVVKACQALAYAHTKGVIHRDLKPANIMVGRFGEVYVMDWGLAKITGKKDLHDIRLKDTPLASASVHSKRRDDAASTPDSPLITMDGSVVGTPAYMPPEQARGQVEDVDQASDIYSLGAILYNLLTGQPPYVEAGARLSPHTILAMVVQGSPKRIHQLNPEASPELIAICEKAMALEKRDRYASSLDLAEDLQAFLDHRVVRAYRTGALAEFQSWVARNRTTAVVATGATVLLMSLLGAGVLWERAKAFRLQESLARQYLRRGHTFCESGDVTRGLHWLARALSEAPARSLALRSAIQENLAAWSRELQTPAAVLHHDALAWAGDYSADGSRVLITCLNGTLSSWSAVTGERLGPAKRIPTSAWHDPFDADGAWVIGYEAQVAQVISTESGQAAGPPLRHAGGWIEGGTVSSDGTRAITVSEQTLVRVWSITAGEPIGLPMRHTARVRWADFSPDGTRLATGCDDGTAQVWSTVSGTRVGPALKNDGPARRIQFSPDGKRLLVTGIQSARIWPVETGLAAGSLLQHGAEINVSIFSPDGQRVLTAGANRSARLWSAETGQPVGKPMVHEDSVLSAAFSPDGNSVLTGSADRTAQLWSAESGEALDKPMRHSSRVQQVRFRPDGRQALTRPYGQTVVLWSLKPPRVNAVHLEGTITKVSVRFSPDGKRLAAGSYSGSVRMWEVANGKQVGAAMNHSGGFVWDVDFSPDGSLLLTTGSRARLWSGESGEPLGVILTHSNDVRAGAFSPDGKLIATGSFDHTARVWQTQTGQPVTPAFEHPNFVEDVAFSQDGKALLTGCGDGAARLWAVPEGKLLLAPMWHQGGVLAVAVQPGGKQAATGSRDNTARFWDLASGRPTGSVLEHTAWVEDLHYTPDGKRLWTLSDAGTAQLWDVETGEPLGASIQTLGASIQTSVNALSFAVSPDGAWLAANTWNQIRPLASVGPALSLTQPVWWVETLTWTKMDDNGVLSWLDRETWKIRHAQLEKLGGTKIQ